MSSLSALFEGWKNSISFGKLSDDMKMVANLRLDKCGQCQFKTERYAQAVVEKTIDKVFSSETIRGEFKGFSCGICGCLLQKKALAFGDECPAELDKHGIPQQWGIATFDRKTRTVIDTGIK